MEQERGKGGNKKNGEKGLESRRISVLNTVDPAQEERSTVRGEKKKGGWVSRPGRGGEEKKA